MKSTGYCGVRVGDVQVKWLISLGCVPGFEEAFLVIRQLSDDVTLYCGDCRDILPSLEIEAVITDPPWDQAQNIPGSDDPRGLFSDVAGDLMRARRLTVQLGCFTDPSFLASLAGMPFLHVCWLQYVPPSYRGRILVDADCAYAYGEAIPSAVGQRVLPSMCISHENEREFLRLFGRNRTSKQAKEWAENSAHPMPRHLRHVQWLVYWHSTENETVIDPFMGSGTTGVAAVRLDRKFIGIEIDENYFEVACRRINAALAEPRLPFKPRKDDLDLVVGLDAERVHQSGT